MKLMSVPARRLPEVARLLSMEGLEQVMPTVLDTLLVLDTRYQKA